MKSKRKNILIFIGATLCILSIIGIIINNITLEIEEKTSILEILGLLVSLVKKINN